MNKDQADSGLHYLVISVDEYSRYVHEVPTVEEIEASAMVLTFLT